MIWPRCSRLERVDSIACPVLAVNGAKDRFVTPGARSLADAMVARGEPFEWRVVEGVGHGFTRNTSRGYRPDAGAGGWRLPLDFLDRELRQVATQHGGREQGRDPMATQPA